MIDLFLLCSKFVAACTYPKYVIEWHQKYYFYHYYYFYHFTPFEFFTSANSGGHSLESE